MKHLNIFYNPTHGDCYEAIQVLKQFAKQKAGNGCKVNEISTNNIKNMDKFYRARNLRSADITMPCMKLEGIWYFVQEVMGQELLFRETRPNEPAVHIPLGGEPESPRTRPHNEPYLVVCSFTIEELERRVNERIGQGYVPQGGMTTNNGSFSQPMYNKELVS